MSGKTWQDGAMTFVAGGVGGGSDSFFTMPLDTIKTRMQMDKKMSGSAIGCFRKIVKADGFFGLYRGFSPFFVMATGKAGVRWGTFGVLTAAVDSFGFDRSQNKSFWTFNCGLGAGVGEALVWTAPAERLKTLRQASAGTGTASVPYATIFHTHGVLGLWKGATPTAARSGSNAAIRFTIASRVQDVFRFLSGTPAGEKLPFYANFLAGGTGGAISTVLNNPIDVVKTRMQSGQSDKVMSACKAVLAERGARGFYSGLSARVPQIFLSQAIQFAVVDGLFGQWTKR